MTTTPMVYAIIDVGGGWTPLIVRALPPQTPCHTLRDYEEMVDTEEELDVKFGGVILVGNAALRYLPELRRDSFDGDIVLLSDLHTGEEPDFTEKYPGVRVLSKSGVADGLVSLFP